MDIQLCILAAQQGLLCITGLQSSPPPLNPHLGNHHNPYYGFVSTALPHKPTSESLPPPPHVALGPGGPAATALPASGPQCPALTLLAAMSTVWTVLSSKPYMTSRPSPQSYVCKKPSSKNPSHQPLPYQGTRPNMLPVLAHAKGVASPH